MYAKALNKILQDAVKAIDKPPKRQFVAPGIEVAWDDEQMWIKTDQIVPQYTDGNTCPIGSVLLVQVGVLRCVATVNDQGEAPSQAQLQRDGTAANDDAKALFEFFSTYEFPAPIQKGWLGEFIPLGPEGGLAGGQWALNLRVF